MVSTSLKPSLKTEIREFIRLATPLASAQVAQSMTGFVDTIMMGRLGQEALAAGGLASLTFQVLLATASGVIMGISPLVAEAYGARNKSRIEQLARQGLWLSLLISIPTMFLIGHMDSLMIIFGQGVKTVTLANSYLDVMLWGLFPAVGFAMLRGLVSGLSQARPLMAIVIGGTLFNIVGNYTLGYGKFGFPRLELAGLALSSTLAQWLMFLVLVIYILKQKRLKTYGVFESLHSIKLTIIQELLWIGVPIGISTALEGGLFAVVTYLMGILGTEVLAAHQIVLQTIVVIFMVPLGMSFATTVRVGQWLGQKNKEGMRQAGYVSISSAAIFMTIMAIVVFTNSRQIIGLYLDINNPENAKVLAIATSMLKVAAFAQILDGVQKTAYGALQGLQDTRVPVILGLIAFWGIGLTLGYFFGFQFGFSGTGLWLGQSIGVAVSAGCFLWRFRKLLAKK